MPSTESRHASLIRGPYRSLKTVAGQEQTRFRGRERVGWAFTLTAAAYNLVRLPKLIAEAS